MCSTEISAGCPSIPPAAVTASLLPPLSHACPAFVSYTLLSNIANCIPSQHLLFHQHTYLYWVHLRDSCGSQGRANASNNIVDTTHLPRQLYSTMGTPAKHHCRPPSCPLPSHPSMKGVSVWGHLKYLCFAHTWFTLYPFDYVRCLPSPIIYLAHWSHI